MHAVLALTYPSASFLLVVVPEQLFAHGVEDFDCRTCEYIVLADRTFARIGVFVRAPETLAETGASRRLGSSETQQRSFIAMLGLMIYERCPLDVSTNVLL